MSIFNAIRAWLHRPVLRETNAPSHPLLLEPQRERLSCLYALQSLDTPQTRESFRLLERLYALDLLESVRPKTTDEALPVVALEEAGLLVMRGVRELFETLDDDIQRLEEQAERETR